VIPVPQVGEGGAIWRLQEAEADDSTADRVLAPLGAGGMATSLKV